MEKSTKNRRAIGVLIEKVGGWYQSAIYRGITKCAAENDINVLLFAGMPLESSWRDESEYNVIYKLVNTEKLDGLIISSGVLSNYIGLNKLVKFLEHYGSIPIVSISTDIPGIPSIVFDNKSAMRMAVNHLIENHKYKKIAYLSGPFSNQEADLRYQGYIEALQQHNIQVDKEMIVEGDFRKLSAYQAVDTLLTANKSMPEAIVAANDDMAMGVYERLKELHIKVPEQIAITGFDNIKLAECYSPSITTVSQPIADMGAKAIELMCEILKGHEVPRCTDLSGELMSRTSCGCIQPHKKCRLNSAKNGDELNALPQGECQVFKDNMNQLFHAYTMEKTYEDVSRTIKLINSAMNIDELAEILGNNLKDYGITECYLCLYDNPVKNITGNEFELPNRARIVKCCNHGESNKEYYFKVNEILPSKFINCEERVGLVFYPLFSGNDHFGYIVFSDDASAEFIFETIREHVSNTLKSQMLYKERRRAEEQLMIAIDSLKEANSKLLSLSVIDELTGLYNRRGFYLHGEAYYKEALKENQRFILFFGDLDRLKKINDTYGHKEGDEAIKAIAQAMRKSFRECDIIARLSGDEFTAIAANIRDDITAEMFSERIRANIDYYNSTSQKPYEVSMSLGHYVFTAGLKCSFEELVREADNHLYIQKNKKHGRI